MTAQENNIEFKTHKRVISVMIEALENVQKYSDLFNDFVESNEDYLPTFDIIMNQKTLKLKTSNPIRNEDVKGLKANIDSVNNKSKEELKKIYIETITNGKFSSKGGAGLGFIEMAKISGNNLNYSFTPISDAYSLYTFLVTFNI